MAGSISAQTTTNARVWAAAVGINPERIDEILAYSVAGGVAWTVDASPTADANLITHLRRIFNKFGFANEWADRFVAAAASIGPAAQLPNALATMVDVTAKPRSMVETMLNDLGYTLGTVTVSAVSGGFNANEVKAQAIAAAHQDIVGTAANITVYIP